MKKRWIFLFLILVLLIPIGIWGFNTSKHAIHLYQSRQEVKSILKGGFENIDPSYAIQLLHEVDQDLVVLDKNLTITYPVFHLFSSMPSQIEPSIKYLKALVSYALLFEPKIEPVLKDGVGNQVEMFSLINDILRDDLFVKKVIEESLRIQQFHQELEIEKLPFRFQDDFYLIEKAIPFIDLSSQILPLLPEIIGLNDPANYMLLALNHDELRGGGGFITAIGTLSVVNLTNIDFSIQDSYQIDDLTKVYPLPPAPLQTFMLAQMWLPRDGNWAADFPSGAQQVQSLVQISDDQATKGVIAFDQEAVRQILAVLGPVQVDPEQNIWVDQNNVIEFMEESWASDAGQKNWWSNRKDFIGILGKLILETVMESRDYKMLIGLGKTGRNLLESGHLMVYFNDAVLQSALQRINLDGTINYSKGDFIYWVDSNIGFNKVDQAIQRKLIYEVDLSDLHNLKAELTMIFDHPIKQDVECVHEASYGQEIAYQNMVERCYWDYWRFYRTPDSVLTNAEMSMVPGKWLLNGQDWKGTIDQGWAFNSIPETGGLMVLKTNSSQTIRFDYSLPLEVLNFDQGAINYNLQIGKQLGLLELPVEIHITAPDGFHFTDVPEGFQIDKNSCTWNTTLSKLTSFLKVKFSR